MDAVRFANWLHNGQPSGPQGLETTESGAYLITPDGVANNTITREAGARWALPSEHEWVKAAHFDPRGVGVGEKGPEYCWPYPHSSEFISPADANYGAVIGNTTPVGSYRANFFGTFDMGGNVGEWNEGLLGSNVRSVRGGALDSSDIGLNLFAFPRIGAPPDAEQFRCGFRVVQVPSPGCFALVAVGAVGAVSRRLSAVPPS